MIVNFEGKLNAATITCDIVNRSRNQINTTWSISNFRGVSSFRVFDDNIAPEIFLFGGDAIPGNVPTLTYRNRLTILVFNSDLDRVKISCGSSTFPVQADFVFRIYRNQACIVSPLLSCMHYHCIQVLQNYTKTSL